MVHGAVERSCATGAGKLRNWICRAMARNTGAGRTRVGVKKVIPTPQKNKLIPTCYRKCNSKILPLSPLLAHGILRES